jgi:trehalose synthase
VRKPRHVLRSSVHDVLMMVVDVEPLPLERLATLLAPERSERLRTTAEFARGLLDDRVVWNVNATAHGGGVAEMLQALLAYGRGAGVDTRWLVLNADPQFFAITKRLHNVLHGEPGDGGPLEAAEHAHYEQVLAANLRDMAPMVRRGDIVLLHDPQTAALAEGLAALGAHVVWRSHIGRDEPNALTEVGWAFLRPYLEHCEAFIFSRRQYAPDFVDPSRLRVIAPSVDPFTAKNLELTSESVAAILLRAGLVDGERDSDVAPVPFVRRDGTTGHLRRHRHLYVDGEAPSLSDRLVVQVSRWDHLKDMTGVLRAFVDHQSDLPDDVHLALVGPDVSGVSDDPEGAQVLAECTAVWQGLADAVRRRVHLACLPMDDSDENAILVNALQRHAAVVVQKSIVEGFGLTVTEAMWKARPVVASAVGGIRDQIVDGVDGLLLEDPRDLDTFAELLRTVLSDVDLAKRLGTAAQERVRDMFLGDRHLTQYVELFDEVLLPLERRGG